MTSHHGGFTDELLPAAVEAALEAEATVDVADAGGQVGRLCVGGADVGYCWALATCCGGGRGVDVRVLAIGMGYGGGMR